MKATSPRTTLTILVAMFISAIATGAVAEERKPTLADDQARAQPEGATMPVDVKKPAANDGGEAAEVAPAPKKRPGKAPRPLPPPEAPYDDDADERCGHSHCFGWLHRHRHAPSVGAHQHDGLFLRLTAGPGFGSWQGSGTATAPSTVGAITNPQSDGSKGGGSISLGGAVGENLILHGDLWFNGNSPRQTRTAFMEFGTAVAGGGLTYYFMPHNIFVSGGIGMATSWLVVLDPNDMDREFGRDSRHDRIPDGFNYGTGIGAYLMVGKEWWVSDNWGLGVGLQGDFARTQGKDLDINYSGEGPLHRHLQLTPSKHLSPPPLSSFKRGVPFCIGGPGFPLPVARPLATMDGRKEVPCSRRS